MADADRVEVVRSPLLEGVAHGFLGRGGGVSTGLVAGLNAGHGAGDDPVLVAENRRRAAEAVAPGARLVTVYQIHSATCVTVPGTPWPESDRPQADALVTDNPALVLGIVTADCAPVLLADRQAGVVGAAHAGWKGAIAGVTDATVAAMQALGAEPSRIVAAVGPSIAQASYEVDEGFRARFLGDDPVTARHFAPGAPGHWQFDLEGYVAARLERCGVAVDRLGLDTYAAPQRFYSFRRATHCAEPSYGRQISLISAL